MLCVKNTSFFFFGRIELLSGWLVGLQWFQLILRICIRTNTQYTISFQAHENPLIHSQIYTVVLEHCRWRDEKFVFVSIFEFTRAPQPQRIATIFRFLATTRYTHIEFQLDDADMFSVLILTAQIFNVCEKTSIYFSFGCGKTLQQLQYLNPLWMWCYYHWNVFNQFYY